MALFIVRHQHDAERCPAKDPYRGATLLNYFSRPNVRKHGIEIQGEAIVRGEHTMYMIVESSDEARVREFMRPFAMAGQVEVYPAVTCAGVVSNGGCGAAQTRPGSNSAGSRSRRGLPMGDRRGLVVHRAHPLNCETSLPALVGGNRDAQLEFLRAQPFSDPEGGSGGLAAECVNGLVDRPLSLSLRDLTNMPSQTRVVTLECAGNGRSQLDPQVKGEQWNFGAVSTAEWTGVPLVEVLDRTGVKAGAAEVLFRGIDSGTVEGLSESIRFERSLCLDDARDAEVLLAYAMNGEPLPVQHGYPLRVIVPDWYAVASVKWLAEIEVIGKAFEGHYQTGSYFYEWQRDGMTVREPVTLQRVRSLITEPEADAEIERGALTVRGVAWSGAAPIARVDVSINGGPWRETRLVGERKRHSWQWWELFLHVDDTGRNGHSRSRSGHGEPDTAHEPEWNRLGYGNNAIQKIRVLVK